MREDKAPLAIGLLMVVIAIAVSAIWLMGCSPIRSQQERIAYPVKITPEEPIEILPQPVTNPTRTYQQGYNQANTECIDLQKKYLKYIEKLQRELNLKNIRLLRLNQLDNRGRLITSPYQSIDVEDVTGKEEWQK